MRSRISGNRKRFYYQPRKSNFKENTMKIKATESKTYSPAPAGSHIATCIAVIDMGTQQTDYNGEIKHQRKLMLTFELSEEAAGLRDDGKRFTISKRYTASLHEKSSLRKDLIAWRGRDFTPAELEGFEVNNVAGKTCMISVAHVENGGSTYANIVSIMGAPKGVTNPGASVAVTLSLEPSEFNALGYEALGDKLREIIAQSPEYKALGKAAPAGVVAEANEEF
jgi:hypothetical protein